MKILIWTLSFGKSFKVLTQMWLDSLIKIGGWDGDVVILTDEEKRVGRVHYFDVRPYLEGIDPLFGYNGLKGHIQSLPSVWDYDYIHYNDSDILINSPRVRQVLEAEAASGKFVIQKDRLDISSKKPWTGWKNLTDEERITFADDSLCAGMFGMATNQINRQILDEYHGLNRVGGWGGSDQKRLILLLFRKYTREHWKYIDRNETAFGDTEHELGANTWIHFSGVRHAQMAKHYTEVLKLGEVVIPPFDRKNPT